MRTCRSAVVGAAAVALLAAQAGVAGAQEGGIETVAGGLEGPRAVADHGAGRLLVAESGTGEVSSVDTETGAVEAVVTGLVNPQGVAERRDRIYIAVGEPGPPEVGVPPPAEPPPVGQGGPGLVITDTDGTIVSTVDTLAYELEHNPDGQTQYVDGAPVDSLSNPFAVLAQRGRVLVADAGANDVLSVDRETGEVSTFFVPPVVTDVPACENAANNPGTVGCDPVPTGLARGPDGRVYVSTLGGEAAGAARVYVLDSDGDVVDVLEDFTSAAGVAVDRDGNVYVAELLEGMPAGMPGPGFDPATVGRVVRVDTDGERTYSQVTMPSGLLVEDGTLYASAWSVAGFVGLAGRGEVVRVGDDSFEAAG
ncbi:ScyD/ScyE family protein [Geodermatophilus sp. SYSU D01186]